MACNAFVQSVIPKRKENMGLPGISPYNKRPSFDAECGDSDYEIKNKVYRAAGVAAPFFVSGQSG
jgi:hypothetical protein